MLAEEYLPAGNNPGALRVAPRLTPPRFYRTVLIEKQHGLSKLAVLHGRDDFLNEEMII